LKIASGEVHVWLAREALADDAATVSRFHGILSDEERARLAAFRVESARRQHLVARGIQREVLSRYAPGIAPRDWRFVSEAAGRPACAPSFGLDDFDFNLSHTEGLVALVVARDVRVGIDVENRDKPVRLSVAQNYFSVVEIEELDALPADLRPERFLRLWTLKEAWLKARGTGLAGGLASVTFRLDDAGGGIRCEAEVDAAAWQFRQYTVGQGCLLALALTPAPTSVTWFEFERGAAGPASLEFRMLGETR
jgi:4'-phosphopantetheinyl transferase